jgi:hypothetical protein
VYFVSFIVALVFMVVAACLFGQGLVRLYRDNRRGRGLISSGFGVGLLGIIITAVIFGFFNL